MNSKYSIDFEKFFELVTKKSQSEKNTDSTVTEIWQPDTNGELKIMNKEMVDNKTDLNNHLCSLRYDFLNGLLNEILAAYQTPDGKTISSINDFSLGQSIIFTSFMNEGVIKETKN